MPQSFLRAPSWALKHGPVHDAVADVPDVRDHIYRPALTILKASLEPERDYAGWWHVGRVRDQGAQPSCVGHALAAVIDHLRAHNLASSKEAANVTRGTLDRPWVSWRMLYETSRFHDEWAGENYGGSSIRGGLKGFFYNGVCSQDDEDKFRQQLRDETGVADQTWVMTKELAQGARSIQLGAYYRVRPRLPDMHAALNEGAVLLVSAATHQGWRSPIDGRIEFDSSQMRPMGLHAFVIVGYNEESFCIQNSWGRRWGREGFARWSYEDWAANHCDAWVLHLAVVPASGRTQKISLVTAHGPRVDQSETHFLGQAEKDFSGPSRLDVLGHLVPFRDGRIDEYGPYNTNRATLNATFGLIDRRYSDEAEKRHHDRKLAPPRHNLPATDLCYRHVLIYFMGSWPDESKLASELKGLIPVFKSGGIYPLFFVWETALFKELELLTQRTIAEMEEQGRSAPRTRRDVRDRLIEGRIAIPGNRILRELRWSARQLFVDEQQEPDLEKGFSTGDAGSCLGELFETLNGRYRKGTISYHIVAHGFGAQLVVASLKNQERINCHPSISSCSLISPVLATDRAKADLLPHILGRGERSTRGRAAFDQLVIERLRLYVMSRETMRRDRFSDGYGRSWPQLWARVAALSTYAAARRLEDRDPLPGKQLSLLSDADNKLITEGIRDGLNISRNSHHRRGRRRRFLAAP